jgi:hypothetical protein
MKIIANLLQRSKRHIVSLIVPNDKLQNNLISRCLQQDSLRRY